MTETRQVRVVEVGPRDGLQNEATTLSLADKCRLIDDLAVAGLLAIEAGSFVDPARVPQMADSDALFRRLIRRPGVSYSALTPNLIGYQRARAAGADRVAVFAAASETFSRKNINCSVAESLARFTPVLERARDDGVPVRGYVSCVAGCPYEGRVDPERVAELAARLYQAGCDEVSLGDTIGVGTPGQMRELVTRCARHVPLSRLAVHCHDTYGQALANIYACLEAGISVVDSAVAGLGGCPYAPGASGNVATEDLVYMLDGLGVHSGIELGALVAAGNRVCTLLQRPNQSRVGRALGAAR
jgi:hydroxymethylglutaryl-CoA lyase